MCEGVVLVVQYQYNEDSTSTVQRNATTVYSK
jgi:hypothetical protein